MTHKIFQILLNYQCGQYIPFQNITHKKENVLILVYYSPLTLVIPPPTYTHAQCQILTYELPCSEAFAWTFLALCPRRPWRQLTLGGAFPGQTETHSTTHIHMFKHVQHIYTCLTHGYVIKYMLTS